MHMHHEPTHPVHSAGNSFTVIAHATKLTYATFFTFPCTYKNSLHSQFTRCVIFTKHQSKPQYIHILMHMQQQVQHPVRPPYHARATV